MKKLATLGLAAAQIRPSFEMTTRTTSKFEKVLARDVAALIPSSVHCVFARHVAMTDPESVALVCRDTSEWALGGALCGRLEIPEVWSLLKTSESFVELAAAIRQLDFECNIALVQPMTPAAEIGHSFDLHFVRETSRDPASASHAVGSLSIEDFGPGRMHDEIRSLLGNPQLLIQDFGDLSKFFVCKSDGVVVAVADAIVSHEGHTAIQQVYTAEAYRQRGIASSLVAQMSERIVARGATALYVCAESNRASAKTAEGAGFTLAARLPNFEVGQ